jgi:hypothetical protein
LRAAYELDRALSLFSRDLANDRVAAYKHGHVIDCERDLNNIMQIIRLELLPKLQLPEFFSMNPTQVLAELRETESSTAYEAPADWANCLKAKGLEGFIKQYALLGEGEGRNAVTVDCARVWAACGEVGITAEALYREFPGVVKAINAWLLNRYEKHFADIIKNIEGDIRYHKLEKRETVINAHNPLIKGYFHELRNGSVVLCNGFIFDNKDVTKDIAGKGQWNYFRRSVVIWSDSAKLRYGTKPADNPELWQRMEQYVTSMAHIFKGLRLDNAHGTPLEVSEYMLTQARKVNPNLIVVAELFTGNSELDALFVSRLGINLLVREAMMAKTPRDLSNMVYSYGNGETKSVGSIEPCAEHVESLVVMPYDRPAAVLVPTATPAVFYDCTHDNDTPGQKRTPMDALPNAAIVCFTNTAVASTRGYDELIPAQLSISKEKRLYRAVTEQPEQKETITMGHGSCSKGLRMVLEYLTDGKGTDKVEIKGSWDNWQQAIPLQYVGNQRYDCVLLFPDAMLNSKFAYKYVINGKNWVTSSLYPLEKDTRGIDNNVLTVIPQFLPSIPPSVYETIEVPRGYLNALHARMALEGFSEIFVSMESEEAMIIVRQNPATMESYVLIARTYYKQNAPVAGLQPIKLPGVISAVELISQLSINDWRFVEDRDEVNGYRGLLECFSGLSRFASISHL